MKEARRQVQYRATATQTVFAGVALEEQSRSHWLISWIGTDYLGKRFRCTKLKQQVQIEGADSPRESEVLMDCCDEEGVVLPSTLLTVIP